MTGNIKTGNITGILKIKNINKDQYNTAVLGIMVKTKPIDSRLLTFFKVWTNSYCLTMADQL